MKIKPLSLNIKMPKLNLKKSDPQLDIDMKQNFATMGLKDYLTLGRDLARENYQKSMEGISNRTSEGKRLSDVQNDNNKIPKLAAQKFFTNKQFGLALVPKVPPQVNITDSELEGNLDQGHVKIVDKKYTID